jgi:hypothetical protein
MPFGHDISDPFTAPYMKFYKPSKGEVDRLISKMKDDRDKLEYPFCSPYLYK